LTSKAEKTRADIEKFLIAPDKLHINKKLILEILDAIQDHWSRNAQSKMANIQYAGYMETIKLSIHLTKEEVLENIWMSIMLALNEVQRLNAFQMSMKDNTGHEEVSKLYDIAISKLKSGELFKDAKF
jgi:hypothetical protein